MKMMRAASAGLNCVDHRHSDELHAVAAFLPRKRAPGAFSLQKIGCVRRQAAMLR